MEDKDKCFSSAELTKLCEHMWNNDENALYVGEDYELDLGGRTKYSTEGIDHAKNKLFKRVDSKALDKPTFKAFVSLLDNYVSETGVEEVVTNEEKKENLNFINLIFETSVMKDAHKFLVEHKKADKNIEVFKKEFYDMWFQLYSREHGGKKDSSGFEHVFVGETRKDEVIGFHNWIKFYLEEKKGKVDYMGYMASDRNPNFLTVQFSWNGDVKPKGSMFIGVSPEFEIALYTVCFLMGHENYLIELNGEPIMIKAYKTKGRIGSTFPQNPPFKK